MKFPVSLLVAFVAAQVLSCQVQATPGSLYEMMIGGQKYKVLDARTKPVGEGNTEQLSLIESSVLQGMVGSTAQTQQAQAAVQAPSQAQTQAQAQTPAQAQAPAQPQAQVQQQPAPVPAPVPVPVPVPIPAPVPQVQPQLLVQPLIQQVQPQVQPQPQPQPQQQNPTSSLLSMFTGGSTSPSGGSAPGSNPSAATNPLFSMFMPFSSGGGVPNLFTSFMQPFSSLFNPFGGAMGGATSNPGFTSGSQHEPDLQRLGKK